MTGTLFVYDLRGQLVRSFDGYPRDVHLGTCSDCRAAVELAIGRIYLSDGAWSYDGMRPIGHACPRKPRTA